MSKGHAQKDFKNANNINLPREQQIRGASSLSEIIHGLSSPNNSGRQPKLTNQSTKDSVRSLIMVDLTLDQVVGKAESNQENHSQNIQLKLEQTAQ